MMSLGPWHLKPTLVTALLLVKRMRAQETTHLSSMTKSPPITGKTEGDMFLSPVGQEWEKDKFPKGTLEEQ